VREALGWLHSTRRGARGCLSHYHRKREARYSTKRSCATPAKATRYARTQTTAQLVKPKKFSFIWALVWFLLFGIGLIVYLLYYWGKRDQTVYLAVDERGNIRSS
jgi:hypothetical protein